MAHPTTRLSAAIAGAALLAAPAIAVAERGADDPVPRGAEARRGADDAAAAVEIEGRAFHPAIRRVARGRTVVWKWRDGQVPHNVTFSAFHSATKTSGTFRHRFTRRGTFTYRCTIHPGMTGKVIVR